MHIVKGISSNCTVGLNTISVYDQNKMQVFHFSGFNVFTINHRIV